MPTGFVCYTTINVLRRYHSGLFCLALHAGVVADVGSVAEFLVGHDSFLFYSSDTAVVAFAIQTHHPDAGGYV